jgi:uroporphyrinogen-III decarboxylase
MGNIDITVLETNNRDLIREEVLSKLNGMRELQKPYIFMSDHSISPGVDLSSYQYMLELFRENCSY